VKKGKKMPMMPKGKKGKPAMMPGMPTKKK
jgi:hypothetical protein